MNESSSSPDDVTSSATVIDIQTREERPTQPTFEDFWAVWPKKVAKKDARIAWQKAVKRGVDPNVILDGARCLAANPPERQFIKHPSGWINGERWDDDDVTPAGTKPHTQAKNGAFPEASSQW